MKNYFIATVIASALFISFVIVWQQAGAQNISNQSPDKTGTTIAQTKTDAPESAQTFVTNIPAGYRDWRLISVAHEEGKLNDIRAILGNDIAIKAYRDGEFPFPEGTIIARLAWSYVASEENNKIFGSDQSFVAGHPTNGVQFMIKDSIKYAATGGWGYGHFNDGKSADEAMLKSCFPCHLAGKSRDFIFTRYTP